MKDDSRPQQVANKERTSVMGQYSISTLVNLTFDRALDETRLALEEEGFIVITEIDLQAQLSLKLNREIPPYAILGVWEPSWEYEALSREPDIGLLMPSHLCLWDNGDSTCTLATADLKHLCHIDENPPLADAARAVNARLRAVVASVQFTGLTGISRRYSPSENSKTDPSQIQAAKGAANCESGG